MTAAIAQPQQISALGWIRLAVRLIGIIALLIICISLYYIWKLAGADQNPWPRLCLAGIGRTAGLRVHIEGRRVPGGAMLLANHVSWLDIPAIASATGAAFVAHDGLATAPIVRWLCHMNDTVFIARNNRTTVATQVEQIRSAIHDTGALAIFPEGTTSDGTGVLPFKSSLLSALDPMPAGIAVQPVHLDYGSKAAEIAWVGEEHGIDNFRRILARPGRLHVKVRLLPPLTGNALTNRKVMAAAAHDAITAALPASS